MSGSSLGIAIGDDRNVMSLSDPLSIIFPVKTEIAKLDLFDQMKAIIQQITITLQ